MVVNYNSGDFLRGCIRSLARQTHRNFETILVDNASTDGSLDSIEEKPARLTILRQNANLGFASANNIAALAGSGRWLAMLNPDAEAEPDWLDQMIRAVKAHPRHRMVASLQIDMADAARLDGAGDCYLAWGYAWRGGFGHPASETPPAGECFSPCGAAALYPRDAFLDAGGFDERYFCYHEDVDIGFRLRLMGERCQFAPSARVRHAGSAVARRSSYFSVFHGVRNGVWTYAKNMPGRLVLITLPVWFAGAAALLARSLARRTFPATLKGLMAGIAGLGPAITQRKQVRALRKGSPAHVAASFTWNPFAYLGRSIDVRPFGQLAEPGRPTE